MALTSLISMAQAAPILAPEVVYYTNYNHTLSDLARRDASMNSVIEKLDFKNSFKFKRKQRNKRSSHLIQIHPLNIFNDYLDSNSENEQHVTSPIMKQQKLQQQQQQQHLVNGKPESFRQSYNQHKNKKPVHVNINQQSINGLLSLLLLFTISICGCLGNVFLISSLTVIESLQTRGNCFLVSMALAHLLVTLFVIPSSAVQIMAGEAINAKRLCHYQWLTLDFCLIVSQLSFLLIAADNYLGYRSSEKVTTYIDSQQSPEVDSKTSQLSGRQMKTPTRRVGSGGSCAESSSRRNLHAPQVAHSIQLSTGSQRDESHRLLMSKQPTITTATTSVASNATNGNGNRKAPKTSASSTTAPTTATTTSTSTTTALANSTTKRWAHNLSQTDELGAGNRSTIAESPNYFASSSNHWQTGSKRLSSLISRLTAISSMPRSERSTRLCLAQQFADQEEAELKQPKCLSYRNCCGRLKVLVWILLVWCTAFAYTLHQHELGNYGAKFCELSNLQAPLVATIVQATPKSMSSNLSTSARRLQTTSPLGSAPSISATTQGPLSGQVSLIGSPLAAQFESLKHKTSYISRQDQLNNYGHQSKAGFERLRRDKRSSDEVNKRNLLLSFGSVALTSRQLSPNDKASMIRIQYDSSKQLSGQTSRFAGQLDEFAGLVEGFSQLGAQSHIRHYQQRHHYPSSEKMMTRNRRQVDNKNNNKDANRQTKLNGREPTRLVELNWGRDVEFVLPTKYALPETMKQEERKKVELARVTSQGLSTKVNHHHYERPIRESHKLARCDSCHRNSARYNDKKTKLNEAANERRTDNCSAKIDRSLSLLKQYNEYKNNQVTTKSPNLLFVHRAIKTGTEANTELRLRKFDGLNIAHNLRADNRMNNNSANNNANDGMQMINSRSLARSINSQTEVTNGSSSCVGCRFTKLRMKRNSLFNGPSSTNSKAELASDGSAKSSVQIGGSILTTTSTTATATTTATVINLNHNIYWLMLFSSVVFPAFASSLLFARAYVKMKEFKTRPYKPMPLIGAMSCSVLNSTHPILMPHSPVPLIAQQQVYTFPSDPSAKASIFYAGKSSGATPTGELLSGDDNDNDNDEETEDEEGQEGEEGVENEDDVDDESTLIFQRQQQQQLIHDVEEDTNVRINPTSGRYLNHKQVNQVMSAPVTGSNYVNCRRSLEIDPSQRFNATTMDATNMSQAFDVDFSLPANYQEMRQHQHQKSQQQQQQHQQQHQHYQQQQQQQYNQIHQHQLNATSFSAPPSATFQESPLQFEQNPQECIGNLLLDAGSGDQVSVRRFSDQRQFVQLHLRHQNRNQNLNPQIRNHIQQQQQQQQQHHNHHHQNHQQRHRERQHNKREYEFSRNQFHAQTFHYGYSSAIQRSHLSGFGGNTQTTQVIQPPNDELTNYELMTKRAVVGQHQASLPSAGAHLSPMANSRQQQQQHQLERHLSLPRSSRFRHYQSVHGDNANTTAATSAEAAATTTTTTNSNNNQAYDTIKLRNGERFNGSVGAMVSHHQSEVAAVALANVIKSIDDSECVSSKPPPPPKAIPTLTATDNGSPSQWNGSVQVKRNSTRTEDDLNNGHFFASNSGKKYGKLKQDMDSKFMNSERKSTGERKVTLYTYFYMTDDQLLKSNMIVFMVNLILWLPFVLLSIVSQYREHLTQELRDSIWWLATLNCCSCSYVYALSNKDFREAYNKLFYYCCCKSHVTFTRKTPIFRRQLDVDGKGNLRVHIIPGLNLYSNKTQVSTPLAMEATSPTIRPPLDEPQAMQTEASNFAAKVMAPMGAASALDAQS